MTSVLRPSSTDDSVTSEAVRIYLSGSIRKGADDPRSEVHFWTDADEEALQTRLRIGRIETLNPAKTKLRRNDFYANFGCDLYLVESSHLMLVDARTEKGIGIGAEMMFARDRCVPVVTICPPETNYRRSFVPDVFGEDLHDWIHPFVAGLSDHIVDDLDEAISLINRLGVGGLRDSVGPPVEDRIAYFLQTASAAINEEQPQRP